MKYEIVSGDSKFPIDNEKNKDRYVDFYEHLNINFIDYNKMFGGRFVAGLFITMYYYQEIDENGDFRPGGFKFNTGNQAALDGLGRLPASDTVTINKID